MIIFYALNWSDLPFDYKTKNLSTNCAKKNTNQGLYFKSTASKKENVNHDLDLWANMISCDDLFYETTWTYVQSRPRKLRTGTERRKSKCSLTLRMGHSK